MERRSRTSPRCARWTTRSLRQEDGGHGGDPEDYFVRNQPLGLSVASVIAMAKAQGITLSDSLVRKVRGPDGGKSKASAPKKVPGVKTAALKSKKPAKDVVKRAATKPTVSTNPTEEASPPSSSPRCRRASTSAPCRCRCR